MKFFYVKIEDDEPEDRTMFVWADDAYEATQAAIDYWLDAEDGDVTFDSNDSALVYAVQAAPSRGVVQWETLPVAHVPFSGGKVIHP